NAVGLALLDPAFNIEPGRDYTPVFRSHETPYVVIANPAIEVHDIKGMIAYAGYHFASTTFGTPGLAGMTHLNTELLKKMAGFDADSNAYKGEPQSVMALISGEVQFMLASGYIRSFLKSGRVVGLATTGAKRWFVAPGLPTLRELGINNYVAV